MPRHRTLDGFVEAVSHTEGVGLADVDAFTTLVVQTDNSVYQITILQPYRREVYVQGGAFFPMRTRACLSVSSFGGSCLKLGWVGIGLHMEFHAEDQWIITSHVRSIVVEPSATGRPSYDGTKRLKPASSPHSARPGSSGSARANTPLSSAFSRLPSGVGPAREGNDLA